MKKLIRKLLEPECDHCKKFRKQAREAVSKAFRVKRQQEKKK